MSSVTAGAVTRRNATDRFRGADIHYENAIVRERRNSLWAEVDVDRFLFGDVRGSSVSPDMYNTWVKVR